MWGGYGNGFFHVIGFAVWGLAMLVGLVVILGLIALLVRFLLVATTAAKIYVTLNARDAAVVAPAPPTPAEPTPAEPSLPDGKPRKPKNPPAV